MSHTASIRALVLAFGVVLCGLVFDGSVQAASIPAWRFDTEDLTADQDLLLRMSIFNHESADQDVIISFILGPVLSGTGPGVFPLPEGHSGRPLLDLQFVQPVVLHAGESYRFSVRLGSFRTLSPGVYGPAEATLTISNSVRDLSSENLFTITVVPEPVPVWLLAVGLLTMFSVGRGYRHGEARS